MHTQKKNKLNKVIMIHNNHSINLYKKLKIKYIMDKIKRKLRIKDIILLLTILMDIQEEIVVKNQKLVMIFFIHNIIVKNKKV